MTRGGGGGGGMNASPPPLNIALEIESEWFIVANCGSIDFFLLFCSH